MDIELRKRLYNLIKSKGLSKSDDKNMIYISCPKYKIYLILWCNSFLMYSTFEEDFKSIHGLSDLMTDGILDESELEKLIEEESICL